MYISRTEWEAVELGECVRGRPQCELVTSDRSDPTFFVKGKMIGQEREKKMCFILFGAAVTEYHIPGNV
jgi:hypothetical protein